MKSFKKELKKILPILEKITKEPSFYEYDREMVEDWEETKEWNNFIKEETENLTAVKMLEMIANIEEINIEKIVISDYFGETSEEKLFNLVEDFYSTYLIYIFREFYFFEDEELFTDKDALKKYKEVIEDKNFEKNIN